MAARGALVWAMLLVACRMGPRTLPPTGDTGSEPGPPGPVGALPRPSIVVPDDERLTFLDRDGTLLAAPTWHQILQGCTTCGGEGGSADGDGLLLSYTTEPGRGVRPGGVARLAGDGTLGFRIDGLGFPHDILRDPADGTLLVVETSRNRVIWLEGDGGSDEPLRELTAAHPEFPPTPNGAELLQREGRAYLLLSHRALNSGRITLWDITTPGEPSFVWRFPAEGELGIPHGPVLREVDGQWWLLWAHTRGSANNGTVGMAVTPDPTVAPTYVADLVPGADVGHFQFLRGVERLSDGRLLLTDAGPQTFGPGMGRVFEATFPDLSPPDDGARGALGSQRFEPLGSATLRLDGLGSPFEGWYWSEAAR